jgi:hypothetical protein
MLLKAKHVVRGKVAKGRDVRRWGIGGDKIRSSKSLLLGIEFRLSATHLPLNGFMIRRIQNEHTAYFGYHHPKLPSQSLTRKR